ncbi:MAG: hypothetical protein INR62_12005 [Rhodospirillales bacterium]|nr:hypothetical protein [Acetobacter sp.]
MSKLTLLTPAEFDTPDSYAPRVAELRHRRRGLLSTRGGWSYLALVLAGLVLPVTVDIKMPELMRSE